ncbi:L-aspartate--glyoxylate aminotransferase BhcA [Roseinatronobacter bogoriensis]|uniref:Aminotransferase class V-fold PLP-dependent enzyme n=1 Tax=Roseinatronobacter bogoriensis subsp. barguzinensis TaxID=441209 RepID=A0A2K8KC13_9RHOB|nr:MULTISPECIES: L-aspartate--glyoxylate aminotransferase BhcA [Rhodobaca]ATX66977.1 aminotransferase class V-fold PLP-dependent enzyme [Rhodobaca barguzinensis]MBB4206470.1 alanine-glyoxylate transaminase/serine-glyoxylate transaminase/serine-pyruvate transaminase [Rhodobaca bogoriensis DSM 18756]TDW41214.1 serine-glyoxylate aminotransferase [Rhodobaca barguzinensis]TDY74608.1 serine-glyoxylate aminotransferase [Rhodobaca bogoriensis DSM 18756]
MSTHNPVFIPGPTNIPEEIRKACDIPTLDHRSPAFARLFKPAVAGIRRVLAMDQGEIIILPSTGTGGWEAAITNTLSSGDKVLAPRFGMFSHRWIDLCQRHGLDVQIIETPWGQGAPLAEIEAALRADSAHEIKAVLATHNETATGVRSDIAGIRRALDAAGHPALLLVDGVSSIGSMPFDMAGWGVDIAVAGSQKGFMLPAGLAILGVSPKALNAMEKATLPRTFFDFRDMLAAYAAGGYPYTPAVGLIAGLAKAIEMLEDEGLENVYARHHRLAEATRRAVAAWGMRPCAATPELYSDTVTAVVVPEGCNGTDLVQLAASKYGVAFGVGLGEVAGKVFRIGHLGMLSDVMLLSGLATAEMCMADLGWDVQLGSGVAAAQEYLRNSAGVALARAA